MERIKYHCGSENNYISDLRNRSIQYFLRKGQYLSMVVPVAVRVDENISDRRKSDSQLVSRKHR